MAFTYEFGCKDCGHIFDSVIHAVYLQCPSCRSSNAKRRWTPFRTSAIQIEPVYNPSLGRMVSGNRDFKDGLKQASDKASERFGVDVNYSPVDAQDTKTLGVTPEGLVQSSQRRLYDEVAN